VFFAELDAGKVFALLQYSELEELALEDMVFVFAAAAHGSGTSQSDPLTWREAMRRPDRAEWVNAIAAELKSLHETGTFEDCNALPPGHNAVDAKFVFKIKREPDGTIERYKARLVAKGYSQMPGVDFDEVFSPVVKLTSVRVLCTLAVQLQLHFYHLDVDTAFLNGDLKEELYIRLPEGSGPDAGKIKQLRRSLYGLKQVSRVWNELLDGELKKVGYARIHADYCIYVFWDGNTICFLAVYVDDMALLGNDLAVMREHKELLGRRFKVKDLGPVKQLLGLAIEYDRDTRTLLLTQTRYIDEALERYGVNDGRTHVTPLSSGVKLTKDDAPKTEAEIRRARDSFPYQSLIGTLMYAMLGSRPDIAYAVGALSKFCSNFGEVHYLQAMHVLRYLAGTKYYGIKFDGNLGHDLSSIILGYSDSDWAGDLDTRCSTGGYVFLMSGAAVSWSSKLQLSPALSSTEAEYIALSRAAQEAIWLRKLLEELGFPQTDATDLLGDNQGSLALAKNPGDHPHTKHIALRYHFIRFAIADGSIDLDYVPTHQMAADGLTKGLTGTKHEQFIRMLGMEPRPSGSVKIQS
jgi:hypothetical protein